MTLLYVFLIVLVLAATLLWLACLLLGDTPVQERKEPDPLCWRCHGTGSVTNNKFDLVDCECTFK